MPSSVKHCGECMFAPLTEADELAVFLEEGYVESHILSINGVENAAPIDMSQADLASNRVIAARGCAKTICEGKCERFIGFVAHGGNNDAKVFIMERDEYEAQ